MDLTKEYLKLLNKRLKGLEEDSFDFEAWKTGTLILFVRLFGRLDYRIEKLEEIKVDYGSSWSMRAVSGSFNPTESARRQSREIVQSAIDELEAVGMEAIDLKIRNLDKSFGDLFTTSEMEKIRKWILKEKPSGKEWNKMFLQHEKKELSGLIYRIYFG